MTKKINSDEYISQGDSLGYYVKSRSANQFTVFLDEPVTIPSYYRNVVNMMIDAGPEDQIVFMVNNPGGLWIGLVSLLEALKLTEATTIAVLTGEAHSSASIFSLHCDMVQVLDSATMLCHNASYGVGGKASDIARNVEHTQKTTRALMIDTYKNFLTDEEIEQMIDGKEFWLDAGEIRERLENKIKAEAEETDEVGPAKEPELVQTQPAPKVRAKRKKKED